MLVYTFILGTFLATASSRDSTKPKSSSSVTHSIVNLGKMEINVYLNEKGPKSAAEDLSIKQEYHELPKSQFEMVHPFRSFNNLRSEPIIEECPCLSSKPRDFSSQSPTDLLNKILMRNDLFSYREPISSSQCCSSHEQVQEEFFIEFSPKNSPVLTLPHQIQQLQSKPFSFLPFLAQNLFQNKAAIPQTKQKALEVFLFPTKKPVGKAATAKNLDRPDLQVVGDKKTTMLLDVTPTRTSVKKDLAKETGHAAVDPALESLQTTAAPFNHSNTL